ncbi:hypothetical protein pkur_cds_76 [Pandoravirus kuranda]|uniref:Uncharacterized protein n=1 Tax=Pandoravirus kuranda TaxID=3019033 RepID=A0AA95J784_9VIRU|nr:hypothetical protein pkur_cds_76 [Pandoravirus kuranda]
MATATASAAPLGRGLVYDGDDASRDSGKRHPYPSVDVTQPLCDDDNGVIMEHGGAPPLPLVEDHVVGSRLARSIPRRRSWIPPWVVGLAVIIVLPLLAALAVFLPWHLADIRPDEALVERMSSTACVVASVFVLDIKTVASDMMLVYLPAVEVYFVVPMTDDGATHQRDATYQAVRAVALPRLERAQSWMARDVADAYFAHYAVNSTTTCYYDPQDPAGHVVMRNGIDDLDRRVGYCVGATISVYVVTLFATVIVAGPHLCY